LHQDYPYWINEADDAENMVTVWLALDDADRTNACLEVLPGSHTLGRVPGKVDGTEFEKNEIDPSTFDDSKMIHVEVEAGDAIFFGPFLVHRSAANTSDRDRRALLYTYQKAGQSQSRHKTRAFVDSLSPRK
jgi:ectoine hydroxylase-related dioxygenase (phytanoyl-CoA dioxygenase family)